MINVDIVIVSDSKNQALIDMMNHTLKTLYSSEKDINFFTYIVESSNSDFSHIHKNIKMIKPKAPFGYHRYLNIGRRLGKSEYVCLCNNDLEFKQGWASKIIKEMNNDSKLLSASPYSNNPHLSLYKIKENSGIYNGYQVTKHVAGWCIFQKRMIYSIIRDLDERFIFWYCDNDYSMTLKKRGLKHALITSSKVNHLTSKTLNTKNKREINILTTEQEKIFNRKWK